MSEYGKPLPSPTALSAPYWQAAKQGRLLIQVCAACGHRQLPPKHLCESCWSEDVAWRTASGSATVYSFAVAHRTSTRGFREDTPYVVAIVELEEGPRLTTNIVGCAPDAVAIGMRVEAVFAPATADITLIKFRPQPTQGSQQ